MVIYCPRCGNKMKKDKFSPIAHKKLRFICRKCGRKKLIKPKRKQLPDL